MKKNYNDAYNNLSLQPIYSFFEYVKETTNTIYLFK